MTKERLYELVRRLIGSPSPNEVSDYQIDLDLVTALEMMAEELQYRIREEYLVTLTLGQRNYPLPPEVGMILWVSHDSNLLEAASASQWDRDGVNYRDSPSGIPGEVAIVGRDLWLNPPPSEDALENDTRLLVRFLEYPTRVEEGGPVGLSELDSRLAAYQTALLWCWANPTEVNTLRARQYLDVVQVLTRSAKRRIAFGHDDFAPTMQPDIYRYGGAR